MKLLASLVPFAALTALMIGFAPTAQADQLKPEQMKAMLGHYVGGLPSYQDSTGKITCSVDVSLNGEKKVVVQLKVLGGIPLHSRATTSDRHYTTTTLASYTHPLMSIKDFLKRTTNNDGDINQSVSKTSLKIKEDWSVRFAYLDKPYGFVQMRYNKSDRWQIYDATLAYIPDLTGCHNLKKK